MLPRLALAVLLAAAATSFYLAERLELKVEQTHQAAEQRVERAGR